MVETAEQVAEQLGFEFTAPRITEKFVTDMVKDELYFRFPGTTMTICLLRLYNGFLVKGSAACADSANFNDEIGRRMAKKDAMSKIWDYAGFWLRQKLWQTERESSGAPFDEPFWIGRVPNHLDGEAVNPAVPHIDAVRDINLVTTAVTSDAPAVEAALSVTTDALASAGLINPGEALTLQSGLVSGGETEGLTS